LLLGHCAAAANAFIPSSVYYESAGNTLAELQASQGALHRVWDQPADTLSQAGLGGGLTYAFDPQLCGKILPLFSEDIAGIEFIDCASIRAAWGRALATWAVHHPKLSFVDVTGHRQGSGHQPLGRGGLGQHELRVHPRLPPHRRPHGVGRHLPRQRLGGGLQRRSADVLVPRLPLLLVCPRAQELDGKRRGTHPRAGAALGQLLPRTPLDCVRGARSHLPTTTCTRWTGRLG